MDSSTPTPVIVAQLQEGLTRAIARSRTAAPSMTQSLIDAQQLVLEVVSRWRRSTTLALDSIKSFEEQLTRKNKEIDLLQKQMAAAAAVRRPSLFLFVSPPQCACQRSSARVCVCVCSEAAV